MIHDYNGLTAEDRERELRARRVLEYKKNIQRLADERLYSSNRPSKFCQFIKSHCQPRWQAPTHRNP